MSFSILQRNYEETIARITGVKPGIVAGRLAKETGNWARFSRFREKVEVGV